MTYTTLSFTKLLSSFQNMSAPSLYHFGISYFFAAQILNKCHLFSLALYFPPPKVNPLASSHV